MVATLRSGARNSPKCWARSSLISTPWSMVLRPRMCGGATTSSTSRRDKWMRSKPNSEAGRGGGRPLVIDLVEPGENRASEFGARASDASEENDGFVVGDPNHGLDHAQRRTLVQAAFQRIARLRSPHSPESAGGGDRDLAITIIQQIAQCRNDLGSRSHAIARRRAYGRVRMPQQPQREQVRKFHAEL